MPNLFPMWHWEVLVCLCKSLALSDLSVPNLIDKSVFVHTSVQVEQVDLKAGIKANWIYFWLLVSRSVNIMQ